MTDQSLLTTYGDLLDEGDDPAVYAVVRTMEQAFPSVPAPDGLMNRIRANTAPALLTATPRRRHYWPTTRLRPVRRSVALALATVVIVGALGGAGYAMRVLGGAPSPHVVLLCSGFGTRWHVAGAGVRTMSPQQFVASGGRLIPHWQRSVSQLQRPRYWVTPDNPHVVDACDGGSAGQAEIGTDQRAHTQLFAFSIVPMWQSNRPTFVPDLRLPPRSGCTLKLTTSPIKATDGRLVAQLAHVPASLPRSVRIALTPCGAALVRTSGTPLCCNGGRNSGICSTRRSVIEQIHVDAAHVTLRPHLSLQGALCRGVRVLALR